ncbi:hypothetical protein J2808_000012 [Pseudarthrobacter sulfonivorans]|nr:hypothetical protein [Pseudarthrobacter sulfonivorans]
MNAPTPTMPLLGEAVAARSKNLIDSGTDAALTGIV